jgi:hypothetical protein
LRALFFFFFFFFFFFYLFFFFLFLFLDFYHAAHNQRHLYCCPLHTHHTQSLTAVFAMAGSVLHRSVGPSAGAPLLEGTVRRLDSILADDARGGSSAVDPETRRGDALQLAQLLTHMYTFGLCGAKVVLGFAMRIATGQYSAEEARGGADGQS